MSPNGSKTVLVVEDDESVRHFSLLVLRHYGYDTLEAFDGGVGLETFLRHREDIDLILTDVIMPFSGPQMADRILGIEPSARLVFMSGTAGAVDFPAHLKRYPMLRKPFTAEVLLKAISQALTR